MPVFPVPDGHDQASWLRHEVDAGLARRFPAGVPPEYVDRAAYEIQVICAKGYPSYFLIVADLVGYARSVDIRVGPGRGSAAGSLVAYALRITDIDPIEHGLLFERFLNPERASMPDIDIDFDDRRRGEMVRYAADKWGHDRVAQVITFGTIKTKAALKDSARIHYGQPGFAIADRITKALPPADHGQGHSAVGHHRPHPRAVQGSRRGARPYRRRSRRPHHLRDRPRPGRPDPQRRRARLRGDHELRAADGGDPAVEAAAGRRHHHRLGLPVVRGHRPAEDGLPRPAEPDDHRRRAGEHPGQQGDRARPGVGGARRRPPPTNCSAAATRSACSSSTAARCAICCAACSPPGSRTSSP